MISNSFIFLEKISTKKEQNIWKQNIHSWNSFIKKEKIKGISKEKKHQYNRILQQAQQHLDKDNLSFHKKKCGDSTIITKKMHVILT